MIQLSARSVDLTKQTFGKWTVLYPSVKTSAGHILWRCVCECGTLRDVNGQTLRNGSSQSCRCGIRRPSTHQNTINRSATPEYIAYHTAKRRCRSSTDPRFANWGGRGIEFRFNSFEEFLEHLGKRPTNLHSLDRIDVNGHYEIGNVRWATSSDQSRNTRKNKYLTVNGETKLLIDWAEEWHIRPSSIRSRLFQRGWCDTCAVTKPIKQKSHCPHIKKY